MTKDMNEMKKKRGRPALGRTRKLTKGVTVKFSPVSYEALRFRARKSGRSLAVYIREVALAATVTARHTPEENALLRSLAGMANKSAICSCVSQTVSSSNLTSNLTASSGWYNMISPCSIAYLPFLNSSSLCIAPLNFSLNIISSGKTNQVGIPLDCGLPIHSSCPFCLR